MYLLRLFFIFALLSAVWSCRRESEISVYRVPKDPGAAPMPASDPHAGMEMPHGGGDPHSAMPSGDRVIEPGVVGEVPEHWKPAGGSSMRIASYRVDGDGEKMADISLVVLPGTAGGVLDNINRWRTQIGLEAIKAEELAAGSETRTTPIGEAVVVDLASGKEGMVAAVVPLSAETWFYKLRGDAGLVGAEKQAFLRWIETAEVKVQIPDPEPPVESPHGAGPPADIRWEKPADWQAKPGDSMRVGIFATTGGAEVTVSRLGGDGGGDLPNVNRWRRQIGLEPLATLEGSLEEVKAGEVTMPLILMQGAEQGTMVAWTLRGGQSWFFKLTGPGDAVRNEREAFIGFLKSIRFGDS